MIIIFAFSVIASISGVFYFFGGYIITKLGFNDGKKRNTLFSAILLIIGSCVIRVFGKIVFDGSWLYEDMLALLCRLGAVVYICSFAAATIAFIVFEPLGQKIRNLIKTA